MLALGTIIASSQCYDFSEQWVIAMVLGAHTASLYKVKKKKRLRALVVKSLDVIEVMPKLTSAIL